MIIPVDEIYSKHYTEGWDSRMSELYVNPYIMDFETDKYTAWKHGWEDADIEIEVDNEHGKEFFRGLSNGNGQRKE